MTSFRFALAQFDFPVGATHANALRAKELADKARDQLKASLIAFPELTLSGYPPEDLLQRPSFLEACAVELSSLAPRIEGIAAVVGHPDTRGEVFNAASLLRGGAVEWTYHKQALPNYTVFDEKRYFRAGEHSRVFEIEGVRVGMLICEDIWEAEPAAHAAAAGAELLLVINASPYDSRQAATRERLLRQRATENDVAIAYVNLVGGQDDLLFDGGSLLVQRNGHIAARAPSFEEMLLAVEFDSASRSLKAIDWPETDEGDPHVVMYAGLVRGVHDYVCKNHFSGVLLGLSGGIDSALTLAIAVDALGADRVTAVMMPTRYTSDLSLHEAKAQAEHLGVEYHVLPIENIYESFVGTLAPVFEGRAPDITEENLQSRSRGVLLMAMSNKTGRLLLSTGNKSEMAVGYATLYGDMCGAYAPLKDLYKTVVYDISRWRAGIDGAIPKAVIERPPSAELRHEQTDQDSLPPYDELDAILERFIEGEQSAEDIIAAGYDDATVRRVIRMVFVNEFKRRQSAPGPRVTTKAFGRERRYPITSGWR
ncbi:NAD+ synthase (glutamine-hydrolysing) [Luteibacter rhizovicinus]|uniref:Glutamine-dependent NAD(+) synthetase n=1 Tax=Luteibacter rhizovicinus TaxID=242606 RepID=A0A4V2W413_9GAMM|nr:NAD+ synthase [Luteibacter rhizovicinus]TCV93909.1 NAD+ synthase (glutamine-hydrolysing) [Luteibacter rhizovicinus]